MKPFYPFLLLLLWCCGAVGQNLVPNWSFEELRWPNSEFPCPTGSGAITQAMNWRGNGSVDYFHACSNEIAPNFGVPYNNTGYQEAKDGEAYAAIAAYALSLGSAREFLVVQLSEPLLENRVYRFSAYFSLRDSMNFAVSHLGAFVSHANTEYLTRWEIMDFDSQVEHAEVIQEKDGWVQVTDTLLAQGGEEYLTIGVMRVDSEIDIVRVDSFATSSGVVWDESGYYVDAIELYMDSTVGMTEHQKDAVGLSIYPNPATDRITVSLGTAAPQANATTLTVTDMLGRRIYLKTLKQVQGDGAVAIDVSAWPSGVYVVQVVDGSGNVGSAKFFRR